MRRGDRVVGWAAVAFALGLAAADARSQAPPPDAAAQALVPNAAQALTPDAARAIARDATLYGLPLVESYAALYAEAVEAGGDRYLAPLDTLKRETPVAAPGKAAGETPNLDVARASGWLDLRSQPIVLDVPEIEANRYYSIQLVDLQAVDFEYLGTRTTGNAAGRTLVAGPRWRGETPPGITRVVRSATDFVHAIYRTQVFDAADVESVQRIQEQYTLQPLNEFLGQPPPASAPQPALQRIDATGRLRFFDSLDYVLQFCPVVAAESRIRAQLAELGIGSEAPFDTASWTAAVRQAAADGMADAQAAIDAAAARPGDAYGAGRTSLGDDYLARAVSARLDLDGVSREESLQNLYVTDAEGVPLDASASRYVLNLFGANVPPVDGFWSLTMYERRSESLVANPIDRYRITSRMLDALTPDASGGRSLYIQHESPGPDKEANWLPAPDGPFYMVLRLYWPRPEAVDGSWKPPLVFAERPQEKPVALPAGAGPAQEVAPLQPAESLKPELERPTAWGEPTEVRIAIYVVDVDSVDSAEQSFAASVYYEARWNSPFLRHKGPGPIRRNVTDVWTPRLAILGQQQAWSAFPEAVEIQPDGEAIYRQKVWGRFSQPLDLHDFPLDRQVLTLHIVAVALMEEHVRLEPLEWGEGRKSGIASKFSLPDFDVVSWKAEPAPFVAFEAESGTAGYRMQIEIERQVNYYILKVIVPLCLIVIMSWLPRWIDPKEVGSNIGVSTTAFLTLVAYLFAITVLLPPVSYITRIDRFILLSTLMVFASLVQTIANTVLVRGGKAARAARIDRISRAAYPVLLAIVLGVSFAV